MGEEVGKWVDLLICYACAPTAYYNDQAVPYYTKKKCISPIFAHSIGLTFLSIGIIQLQLLDSSIIHFGTIFMLKSTLELHIPMMEMFFLIMEAGMGL